VIPISFGIIVVSRRFPVPFRARRRKIAPISSDSALPRRRRSFSVKIDTIVPDISIAFDSNAGDEHAHSPASKLKTSGREKMDGMNLLLPREQDSPSIRGRVNSETSHFSCPFLLRVNPFCSDSTPPIQRSSRPASDLSPECKDNIVRFKGK
jgi:hypothetical protein